MKKSLSKLAQIYFDDANGQRFFDYIVISEPKTSTSVA
jgi:hypothetical protein